MHAPRDSGCFPEAFITFLSTPPAAVLLKSQETFSASNIFIHYCCKCLLPSQYSCLLFLVIISRLLRRAAIPVL